MTGDEVVMTVVMVVMLISVGVRVEVGRGSLCVFVGYAICFVDVMLAADAVHSGLVLSFHLYISLPRCFNYTVYNIVFVLICSARPVIIITSCVHIFLV